jgi:NADH:ubiquinone oxidoreductase subunit 6 (subunit J)
MQAALHLGEEAFILIKTFVTIAAAGFLVLHKNWPLGRLCLALALLGYAALMLYHLHGQRLVGTVVG